MATSTELAKILRGYFSPEYKGVLLEVGAGDPIEGSVSHVFRDLGWTTISVEPNPKFVQEFEKAGLECLPYACCAEDKGSTDFHVSPNPMSCSALGVRYAGKHPIENGAGGWWPADQFKTITVEALTLNTILKKHHPNIDSVDILLIDVEGWELDVLKGFDLAKFSPKVILFEWFDTDEPDNSPKLIFPYLESKGYQKDKEESQDKFCIRKNEEETTPIHLLEQINNSDINGLDMGAVMELSAKEQKLFRRVFQSTRLVRLDNLIERSEGEFYKKEKEKPPSKKMDELYKEIKQYDLQIGLHEMAHRQPVIKEVVKPEPISVQSEPKLKAPAIQKDEHPGVYSNITYALARKKDNQ
jgi:FkbM family methyltransferase